MSDKLAAALRVERTEILLSDLLPVLLQQKRIENKSPRTIEWYQKNIGDFIRYLTEAGHSTRLGDISPATLIDFMDAMTQRKCRYAHHPRRTQVTGGLSPYTLHAYARALRAFFGWLHSEEYASANLAARLKVPRLPKNDLVILTDEQINAVLKSIKPNTFAGGRMLAIFLLLYATGIRASELVGLTMHDLNIEKQYIRVLGKGHKERIVPIGANAQMALTRYLRVFRTQPHPLHIDFVFLTLDGYRMTPDTLDQMFMRLSRRVGFRIYPHLMRHTFAVNYLMNSQATDPFSLQTILGHEDMATVRLYVNLAQQHIEVLHKRYNPADKLDLRGLKTKPFRPLSA